MNLFEEIDKLNEEEFKTVVLHCIGIYNRQFGEKLPFVYCPLCGEEIKRKKIIIEREKDISGLLVCPTCREQNICTEKSDKIIACSDFKEINKKTKEKPIFSGKDSKKMWHMINYAKTIDDLKEALYDVCCHLQELESRLEGKL